MLTVAIHGAVHYQILARFCTGGVILRTFDRRFVVKIRCYSPRSMRSCIIVHDKWALSSTCDCEVHLSVIRHASRYNNRATTESGCLNNVPFGRRQTRTRSSVTCNKNMLSSDQCTLLQDRKFLRRRARHHQNR